MECHCGQKSNFQYEYIYFNIVQFLIFNSTLNCPIQQTKFLFNICFNSQLFNSLVQILVQYSLNSQLSNSLVQILLQYSLQLSIVQLTSPNLCPIFTLTLNCSTHKSQFLSNIHFNSQLSNSLVHILVQYSLQLSIVQLTSPYFCPIFTSTLNCSTY